jgi:eukaryotic-like serine/threonine-protein kinase
MDTQKFANDPKRPQGVEGALQVGSVLQGRYKITGVLGVGGMGSVYLARDMHFPTVTRNVAVKEMLNLASDPNLREMTLKNFEREANILAALSHPAIPKIYDYFSNKDRAYLVMEYINGRDLEAIVNAMPDFVPVEMVRKWAIELCDVLHYLHTHQPEPIVFRDMKPSNVMIDDKGNVRLIDFGIAKAFQPSAQKGTMIGTEGYSPPEQYRGEASPAGDIYALGATLHHILTRHDPRISPPFSFAERSISATNPNVSEDLDRIVMRALTYDIHGRFASALAMKEALENLGQYRSLPSGMSLSAPTSGSATMPMGSAPAGASSAGAQQGARPSSSPMGASAADSFEAAGAIRPLWTFKAEDEIRCTPVVFKGVVYVGTYDYNMWALDAKTGSLKLKQYTQGGIVGMPAISPEDNLLVFGSEDKNLYALDIRTGKITWTFQTTGPIRCPITIAHGHAFFGSDDGHLYAVRLNTGRLAWKISTIAPVRSQPGVTNERIVFGNEEGEVIGLDLAGSRKWLMKAKRAVTSGVVIVDQLAYFGSQDWQVYCVDVQTGFTVWRYRTGKNIIGAPAVVGKQVFVGSADNYMYAIDANSGREQWKFETKGQVISTPVHHNGSIYFGGTDQTIYSLEAKKGKVRWTYETGGPITSGGTVQDNVLYIGSMDHNLYAFSI